MRKFVLVMFIGLVLAMNMYGIVNRYMNNDEVEVEHTIESVITVYME